MWFIQKDINIIATSSREGIRTEGNCQKTEKERIQNEIFNIFHVTFSKLNIELKGHPQE